MGLLDKFGGGGASAMVPPGGGAPMTSPMPMPRPAQQPGPMSGGGGFFGGMDPQKRYDMAMDMLKSGMAMAAQSQSPAAAFLAPLAGSLIGGKIEAKRGAAEKTATEQLLATMNPGGATPEMTSMLEVLANDSAPQAIKDVAAKRLKDAMTPKAAGGGGKGGSTGGSGGKSRSGERLYGQIVGADGVLYGTTRSGQVLPYQTGDGSAFKPAPKAGSVLEDPTSEDNDPLGIR